jgi:hypothetical protein
MIPLINIIWIFFLIDTIRVCRGKGGKLDIIFMYVATIILFFTFVVQSPNLETFGMWSNFIVFTIISQICYIKKKKKSSK